MFFENFEKGKEFKNYKPHNNLKKVMEKCNEINKKKF